MESTELCRYKLVYNKTGRTRRVDVWLGQVDERLVPGSHPCARSTATRCAVQVESRRHLRLSTAIDQERQVIHRQAR